MLKHLILGATIPIAILARFQSFAADVVALRCDFPDFYQEIIADSNGVSVTEYKADTKTKELKQTRTYIENKKGPAGGSHYHINSEEIAWDSWSFRLAGDVQTATKIDLRNNTIKNEGAWHGRSAKQLPTEIGKCKPIGN